MLRALFFLAVFFAGCNYRAEPNSELYLNGFSADEEAEIYAAVSEWNEKAGTELVIVGRQTGGTIPVLYEGERNGGEMGKTRLGAVLKVHLWAYPEWSALRLPKMRQSALHELGHLLSGAEEHSDDAADVMHWEPTAEHLTPRDVAYIH